MKKISGGPLVGKSRILIDTDGCPVVDECIALAGRFGVECLILCDTSHVFEKAGARTLTFSKSADSDLVESGDVVVTQDYGLAAMCLIRHTAGKIRNGGGRLKGPKKRTQSQDAAFISALDKRLQKEGSV